MAPVSPRAEPVNTEAPVTPLFQHIPGRDVAPTTPIVKTPTVENLQAGHTSFSAPAAHPLSHSATQPVSNSLSHPVHPSHTFHHQNDDESSSDDFSCVDTGVTGVTSIRDTKLTCPASRSSSVSVHICPNEGLQHALIIATTSRSTSGCDFNSQEKATGQHLMSIKFAR